MGRVQRIADKLNPTEKHHLLKWLRNSNESQRLNFVDSLAEYLDVKIGEIRYAAKNIVRDEITSLRNFKLKELCRCVSRARERLSYNEIANCELLIRFSDVYDDADENKQEVLYQAEQQNDVASIVNVLLAGDDGDMVDDLYELVGEFLTIKRYENAKRRRSTSERENTSESSSSSSPRTASSSSPSVSRSL